MKKFISCIIICLPVMVFAQSVAINNDASVADNSALLDLKSSTKGLLMPRMTSAERIAIASPALGLTVFDISTFSFWMYRGNLNNGWVELVHSQQNYWTASGTHIFNNTLGNVGIGTNTPASKLSINGADPSIGFLNNGLAIGNLQSSGFDMKIGTHPDNPIGDIVFQPKGIDRVWVDESGQVGIGTATPSSLLTVNGSNPLIQLRQSNFNKGFLQALGNDLKLGTNSTNTTGNLIFQTKQLDRMMIDENGQVGIGTVAPASELTINGTNPYIQMQHGNSNTGFVQASGINLKVGTNSTNTNGNLILQTKLLDRMLIDNNGQVGIGTSSPSSLLTLNGTEPILQIRNANVDKGFIQVVGDNIKIGTNINNQTGKFYVRTNGVDRFSIDQNGNGTLGTNSEGGRLILDGNNARVEFKSNGSPTLKIVANTINPLIEGTAGNGIFQIKNFTDGIVLHPTGHISIGGLAHANQNRVSVHGGLIASTLTELAIINWPDYVFEKNYKLKPLSEVKDFIEKNKHLPNIPPAAEIEKTGVSLGDMSKRLIEKIEELTLYILQQQEQIDELKKSLQK